MKLAKIEFTNFRCFRSDSLEFDEYTSLVGPNNCGKSTALRALNIFFGGNSKSSAINILDFYIDAPIEAQLSLKFEFVDVKGEAEKALSHYVRNNRITFELVATRDAQGFVNSTCRGIRYGLPELASFFSASTASDRKPLYQLIRDANLAELPAWQNMETAVEALRDFEAKRPEQHIAIPSEESAYGATGPIPRLKKFLDWIYIPAVKDASSEASEQRESAFSKLISYAVRNKCDFVEQIEKIKSDASTSLRAALEGADAVLKEVGGEIDKEFKNLTTTPISISIEWAKADDISVKEPAINSMFKDGAVSGAPDVFGHGLQRTYLIALLSLAAKIQKTENSFQLILGIEEPELYQHPPQARYLSNALFDLSKGNCQVLVTTHSPHFVTGKTFESVRVLRKTKNSTKIHSWSVAEQGAYCAARKSAPPISNEAVLSGLDRSLQLPISEMFFASRIVLVEGLEDIAIFESYLRKKGKFNDFLRAGCHFIAVGGKSKNPMLIALARGFSIDVYCIVDFDMNRKPEDQSNGELVIYAQEVGDVIDENPTSEFNGRYFYGWHFTVQHAINAECPSWKTNMQDIANEWGWSLSRLNKDPMLLAECVSRTFDGNGEIAPLQRLCSKLEEFWQV